MKTGWRGPSVARVVVLLAGLAALGGRASAAVVINELLYHPANGAVLTGEDAEDLQFVELYNSGAQPVDLSGWSFSQGFTCPFPAGTGIAAGGYLVAARDPALLALRGPAIPTGVPVVKWVSGDLSNGGEAVQLVDAGGVAQDQVTYDDAGLWPAAADGQGSSLELTNPAYDKSFPLAWRASNGTTGTPGARNSRFTEGPIVLSEDPARGTVVAALSAVSVTFAEPVSGVQAGHLVVDGSAAQQVGCASCANGVGAGPWVFTGFNLPVANPFTVALNGGLKDLDGHVFGGDSWSHYQSVPKVVINEIHYNPSSSTDVEEFVELVNADAVAVNLANWRLTEFASPGCTFPAGTVLQPGAYLVCAKDAIALQAATGFLAAHAWGANDSLSNGGEPVTLLNAGGTVVDRVEYADSPPWPSGPGSPDGNGPSLELTNPAVDNAQGQFWRASSVTHGTPGRVNSVFSQAPVVASELPARGSVILSLNQVSVTFSEPVTGVTAGDLEVNGTPASGVTGEGVGPYLFQVANPLLGAVEVVLGAGAIADLQGTPFSGDAWLYFSSLPRVVINEIHYHPAASSVGAGQDPEGLQFIELYNREDQALDLGGWAMGEGVDLLFPAGAAIPANGFLVLAADPVLLAGRVTLPPGATVLQWTGGELSNGGEKLELVDAYGHLIDKLSYDDDGDWPIAPDGQGPSLELVNPGLDNAGAGAWQASAAANGTPGAVNSVYQANPAPVLYAPLHAPALPRAGQAVTVTVSATDDAGAPHSVTLNWRVDQDPPVAYSSAPMFDDGQHGDGDPGDGRFGATLPGLGDGQQLDFFVTASDGLDESVLPAGHSTPNRFGHPSQTFLCKFSNEALPVDHPVFHIIVTLNNKHNQEPLNTYPGRKEGFDATFIDGQGNIWYNVTERYRGQSSLFKYPSSYNIEFPPSRKLQDSGLGFPVEVLQLNSMRPAAQWLGFTLFNRAGLPAPRTGWAHLRYTGINYDSCCTGQNGYWGMHVVVERYDDEFLDSQDGAVADRGLSSEGNLYRGRNDANLRWEGTDPNTYRVDANGQNGYEKYNNDAADSWGDLIALCDAVSNSDDAHYVEHVKAHVDEDSWAEYFALMTLMGNREGGIYRDTGDDYFIYLPPVGDPLNPTHPAYATAQLPGDLTSGGSRMLPWDVDSVLWDSYEGIWRQNVSSIQRFLRHNAFAPIYVKALEDLSAGPFSAAQVGALIDSMPPNVFGKTEGSDVWPETKQQYKNWVAGRLANVLGQTADALTLNGGTQQTSTAPVITLGGALQQAGTHDVTVNGHPASFSVYAGTWSYDLALEPGMNFVLVQAWDRQGAEKQRVEAQVFHNPDGAWHLGMALRAPRRMVNDKTLTIDAAIVDPIGRPLYTQWEESAAVSVVRLPGRTPVAITNTVFEDHVTIPDGTMRLLNGWGSVSFTLNDGAAFAAGDIEVSVSWHGLKASRVVSVLNNPAFRDVGGNLTGAALVWGPDENIRVTGNCTVPAGSTLTILPGTMVQVDTTGSLENGTLVVVNGALQALGTRDNPIFFFSERGPAAMTLTQSGSASNGDAWRGFQFYGAGSSTLRQVFLTGAGNGNVVSHPRPPILGMFNTHNVYVDRCVFADDDGMVFSGQGTGSYTVRKCLLSRVGIGGEFFGNGHNLLIKDSWFTVAGRAPEANNLDGDLLHVDGAASTQLIRSCILNDGGDDGLDHSASSFTLEHSIVSHVRDKACSMTGGHVTTRNVLMFDTATGIRGTASTDHTTIAVGGAIATNDDVQTSIVWPHSLDTCSGTVGYTDVGNPALLGCGTGNLSTDPLWKDAAHHDYNPRPGSPALTAGPNQDRIGWLGFPYGSVCQATADCNDTNACTTDVCVDKLCVFTPVVGCVPCDIHEDCDDGNACTLDTCAADGSCQYVTAPGGTPCSDGKSCTSPDVCTGRVCGGPENCPGGAHCDASFYCVQDTNTVTFQQGVNGYSGTHDTTLHQGQPDTILGADEVWRWDLGDPAPAQVFGVLRFADVFGSVAGQVPSGALIASATLIINVEDPSSETAGTIHEAKVAWDEGTATWNNFGGEAGVQADEYGPQVGIAPLVAGTFSLDVTNSLKAWQASPATNQGWVFVPRSEDGIRASSSERSTIAWRPLLSVTYIPPVNLCTNDAGCADGLYCNGVEKCAGGTCKPGSALACDDGVPCSLDSCDEATDQCKHARSDVLCDDGDLCTDDACDLALGCVHVDNLAACDDGNACTAGDSCKGGLCGAGAPVGCDDGVACTIDACDPASGCTHADACPAGQVCSAANGACEAGPTVLTFQDGVNGYDGTVDTYLHAGNPDADNSLSSSLIVDGPVPSIDERQILLRFDDLFGAGGLQIPLGARIESATLTMYVTNPSADGAGLYPVMIPWQDNDTWNSLGGGVQLDGVEAGSTAVASGATNSNKVYFDFDVTASLIEWSGGAPDLGWVFVMPTSGTDSWQLASSEDDVIEVRPLLTVTFIPCDPGFVGDGVSCSDLDECQESPGPCDAHADCTNLIGSYTCLCQPGWTGDGALCLDVDECQAATSPCDAHATCANTEGAYTCACDPGWQGDGSACGDVDECQATPDPCDVNATCANTTGAFTCTCNPGYVGDGFTCGDCLPGLWGPDCAQACPGGVATPCNGHGACDDGAAGSGQCACGAGFTGDACQACAAGHFGYPACGPCPDCEDGSVCTDDWCDPAQGCRHQFNTAGCDDGNACTTGDGCAAGLCSGQDTSASDCDDHNLCTDDHCDPASGCLHDHNDAPCQGDDVCAVFACVQGTCAPVEQVEGCCRADAECDSPLEFCRPSDHVCVATACAPCEEDADCGDSDALCLNFVQVKGCVVDCTADHHSCPQTTTCLPTGEETFHCIPDSNTCPKQPEAQPEAASEPVSEVLSEAVAEPLTETVSEPVTETGTETVTETGTETGTEPAAESVPETVGPDATTEEAKVEIQGPDAPDSSYIEVHPFDAGSEPGPEDDGDVGGGCVVQARNGNAWALVLVLLGVCLLARRRPLWMFRGPARGQAAQRGQ
jgi:hypothetical protein